MAVQFFGYMDMNKDISIKIQYQYVQILTSNFLGIGIDGAQQDMVTCTMVNI